MQTIWLQALDVWNWLMDHLIYINLVLSIIIVFFQRRDPKAVWTWLLALYFIPVFGILFYLLLGQDMRKGKMFRVKEVEDRMRYSAKNQEEFLKNNDISLVSSLSRDYEDLVVYNLETSGAVLTVNNSVVIFTDGEEKFKDLRMELSKATHFIHLQYYIIKDDELFDSIIPILIERAKAGVEVRILCDGMGGRFMPKSKWNRLKESGVRVGIFFPPILGRLQLRMNYRNHRKIVVIDNRVGYVGGFNIGREYISRDPKFGYWRDTHLKLQGGAVLSLQIRFALDWNYAAGENLFKNMKYFCEDEDGMCLESFGLVDISKEEKHLGIQIIASGPDAGSRQIRDNYIRLFSKARDHIYIQTPYFVPDDAVLSTLQVAARSGVDVRLMIPCKPDHPFVYWASYSYVGDLLSAGAKCYTYENGFLHSKGVMTDGKVSSYGTANMDIRSFELNFEVNAVIYDEETTGRLEALFLEDLKVCKEITPELYEERSLLIRIKEQGSRLFSPLL
ncbi:cardiolipin synthase [Clostridium sp. Marseille-P2415]|uniref:cardiolipin synthase n=1 Tax=Clostridium sp. Marseille-P2415 TaxID=1805471 RepID=UPI000988703F|nr:cardiolipin synthase [Clostridium sp. Marseille-P2415]